MYLQTFLIAFMATMGFEVALGLCIAIGAISKGASKK
jgi:hypothetical protein